MGKLHAILERLRWRLHILAIALSAPPARGGSPEGEGDEGGDGEGTGEGESADADGEADGAADPAGAGDADAGDGDKGEGEAVRGTAAGLDWKAAARKHEKAEKRLKRERDELATKLKQREDADKSEQDKAVDAARADGEKAASERFEQSRRQDRLEVAVTRAAARGFKVKAGDDEKTLKFADPDDAQTYVERALARGDIEDDDIFDDAGKVKGDALNTVLQEILESKPHLVARNGEAAAPPPPGDSDAGKGSGVGSSIEDLTPEDHFQAIRRHK